MKNISGVMEKIKNIGSRVFDWIKKHRVLSILLCLLLIIFCFKGIVWIYNDIAYGRFVKVGEKYFDDIPYSSLYETDYGTVQLFIPSYNPYISDSPTETAFNRIGDFLIFYKLGVKTEFEIYDKNKDFVSYEKGRRGLFYNLVDSDKVLEFVKDTDEYNLNTNPIIKYNNYTINNDVVINAEKTNGIGLITNLDTKNIILIFCNPRYGKTLEYSYRYSVKEDKLYKLDTSEIPYLNGLHNKLVYLGNNKFLFLQNDSLTEKLTSVTFLTLVNNKFIKQELKTPKNNPPFGFSTDNPLILNANQILFVGGIKGKTAFTRSSKQCFLYDIKKNKIIKLNDFPFRLKQVKFLKTKNENFYIPVVYQHNGHTKHFIYKYKKGRFTS